jgi:Ribonuclease toxin, BrnT, of type II toxin-antitoxin system
VLNDPLGLTIEDDSSEGEPRWITIGANTDGQLLVAIWTERDGGERLISVRRATVGDATLGPPLDRRKCRPEDDRPKTSNDVTIWPTARFSTSATTISNNPREEFGATKLGKRQLPTRCCRSPPSALRLICSRKGERS